MLFGQVGKKFRVTFGDANSVLDQLVDLCEQWGDFGTLLQADGAVAVEYGFGPLTEAVDRYQFIYVAPTLIINVPIRFDFTTVPVSQANSVSQTIIASTQP